MKVGINSGCPSALSYNIGQNLPKNMNEEIMTVSIIVRAYNEEKHIGRLFSEISQQKADFPYEVILVDSGSTDETIKIAKSFNVKIVHINPEDFSFGYSLNQGIENAQGKYCVMISAHCYPQDEHWLENLILPFQDDKVALVYGRQLGDERTKYSERQIIARWFPKANNDDCQLAFCNNANAAIRKSVWEQYKYNEELTGLEDLDWAKYVKKSGMKIVYRADAAIFHIHEEKSRQVYTRYYREALAYRQIYINEHFSLIDFIKLFSMNVIGDYLHAINDSVLLKNIIAIPTFRLMQFWGTYRAHRYSKKISPNMERRLYYPNRPKLFGEKKVISKRSKYPVLIDITRTMDKNIPVWPGSIEFSQLLVKNHQENKMKESQVCFNLHTGTHVDAPSHFIEGKSDIDEINPAKFCGQAQVIDYYLDTPMNVDFFQKLNLSNEISKILLKTRNSNHNGHNGHFDKNFIAITASAARWLVERQIDLIGIDGPSIQSFHDNGNATHEILLGQDIIVLENLDLSSVVPGHYELFAFPLKIKDAEASPVRAILKVR